mmetsp:Transcript_61427/g.179556  ORF Transcript_61427/g.179556 Transcript_61427/m.179556 type:complete len:263 (-) Transcript_61427:2902-3690(-)
MTSLSLSLFAAGLAGAAAPPRLPRPAPAPRPLAPAAPLPLPLALTPFFLLMFLMALSYFLKFAEFLYSAICFSYSFFSSSASSSKTFFSSGVRLLHLSVSCLATSLILPGASWGLVFDTKMKYALAGRFGSFGASSEPRNFFLANMRRFFFSAAALRRRYFLPSALFVNSFISFSYSTCLAAASSENFFWPSAPRFRQATVAWAMLAGFPVDFWSLRKRKNPVAGFFGRFEGTGGRAAPVFFAAFLAPGFLHSRDTIAWYFL